MLYLIIFFSFLTIIMFFYPILKALLGKQNAISRLKKYTAFDEIKEDKKKNRHREKEYKAGLGIIAKGVKDAKFLNNYKRKTQFELQRAHVLLKPEEYITISIILAGVIGLFSFALFSISSYALFFAILGAIIGWIIPSIFLKIKIKKRVKQINDQLSDAIVLISNSLKAGYSFFQSVDIVAKEMTGPMSEEFTLLQKEVNFGTTTEKALENLVNRVSSDDLELVVTAVLIQRQIGGNLAEVLDNISSTIRERIRIKGEIKTVTAQGRMSGLIIALLPPGLTLILFLINKEHISRLFIDPLGWGIVGFSIFMELMGIYFIKKIVNIEV
ncbi:UNVERIFIED_CONTAM: tight adherence protein B [Acetivibrio alkalicellulosi]